MLNLFKKDFIDIIKERFKHCDDIEFEKVMLRNENRDNYFVIIHLKVVNTDPIKEVLLRCLERKIYHLDQTLLSGVKEINNKDLDLIESSLFSKDIITYSSLTGIVSSVPTYNEKVISNKILSSINENLLMIRNSLKSSDYKIRLYKMGSVTKTEAALIYNEETANKEIAADIHKSLKRCTLESVISLMDLANIASGCRRSLLPVFANINNLGLCKKELEKGHFMILMDGQEQSLIGPLSLFGLIGLSNNDYPYLFLERTVKIIGLIAGLFFSGLMAALYIYHPNLLPYLFLRTIIENQNVTILNLYSQFILSEIILLIIRLLGDKTKFSLTVIFGSVLLLGLAYSDILAIDILLISINSFISINLVSVDRKTSDSLYIIRLVILGLSLLLGMLGFAFASIFSLLFIASKNVFNETYLYPLSPLDLPEMWNYLKGKIIK